MKKAIILILVLVLLAGAEIYAQTDTYYQIPPNSTGQKQRVICRTVSSQTVCSPPFHLYSAVSGTEVGLVGAPLYVRSSNGSSAIDPLAESTWTARVGEVQASPTQYTFLGRLKALEDELAQKTEPANTQTVSGTVTANLGTLNGAATAANQTTANTSLSSIDGKLATAKTADFDTGAGTDTVGMTGIALPASGGAVAGGTFTNPVRVDPTGTTTQPVSATSLPLPTGASTAANQSTANTALAAIQTAVELLDNTVAGSELQVDVVGALPAGTNAIGKLAANSGVDIGDVDVTSLPSGSVAAATAKTTDYDTGAGTDTVPMFGVALPKSGGAVAGGTSTDPIRVDPTVSTTQPISAASLPLPTGAATSAKQPAFGTAGSASSDVITVQGIASMTALKVDGSAVTQPVSGTVTASNAAGDVAHDSADSGNPVKIGVEARSTLPGAVTDGDRADATGDLFGRQYVQHTNRALRGNQQTTITSSTTETTVYTAAGVNVFADVYGVIVSNTSATAVCVDFKDATAGTLRFTLCAPATGSAGFMVPASDGHKQATANNNWTATCSASVASVKITILAALER